MGEEKVFYIKFWNAEDDSWEWRKFKPCEADVLLDMGIIDIETVAYYMDDSEAFETALLKMSERSYTLGDFIECYLENTDKELRIEA